MKTRYTRAPFGVRGSTSCLYQLFAILILIWVTYHPNMLAKSLSPTAVGPLDALCGCVARGIDVPFCSPYRARLSCFGGGWCNWAFGVVFSCGFPCLPRIGIAV